MAADRAAAPAATRERPLASTRVLDLSGPFGAYAGRLLSDLGADVIRIVPPTGDPLADDPPVVATTFPPRWNPMNMGRQCPSIAAPPASVPASFDSTSVATSAGAKPFRVSSRTTGSPYFRPNTRHTFVAPMLPLPSVRMSTCLKARTIQSPEGMLPAR